MFTISTAEVLLLFVCVPTLNCS
uniref:Uncharacterized protein n=1 Tax=Anguilla anguilla TaxID=7936 RepID=A0A0E9TER8_ANGAN